MEWEKMETVVIGCKYAPGIVMQVGEKTVVINGFNKSTIIGGHGITENVPKDLWETWLEGNKDRALVKNGLIFAHTKEKSTKAEAEEKKDTKSKTEKLKPEVSAGVEPAEK